MNWIFFAMRLLATILLVMGLSISATAAEREAIATTPYFAFYSDFDTNLHDALLAAGVERHFGRQGLFEDGPEVDCFAQLPDTTRNAWSAAVDYYSTTIAPTPWDGPLQYALRGQLAGFATEAIHPDEFLPIAQAIRAAAAPAYRRCKWDNQHAQNLVWIERRVAQLDIYEATIGERLSRLYQRSWHGLPIHVDIVATVSWSGANSVFLPGAGGHLLISTSYQDESALEVVFHEASHLMMSRSDPVRMALGDAVVARNMPYPSGIWHVVLFNTTGEVVRQALAEAGTNDYTPMIFEIYQRSDWARYRDQVDAHWYPYINAEVTLESAAENLIAAIAAQQD